MADQKRTRSRALQLILGVLGLLLVLIGGLLAALQSGPASRLVREAVVPRVSEALGRELTVRDAKLHLFPHARVVLGGAALAGRPGEPPLVQLESLDVGLEVWPLVTSFGKDVRVAGIRLVRPVVNLVRAADGTWNYEGLGGESAKKAEPAPAKPAGAGPNVVVSQIAIEDGTVTYLDALGAGGKAVAIQKIDLAIDRVGVGEQLDGKLSAAIADEQKNFDAALHVSKLPASMAALGPGSYPEVAGDLSLKGLDLARLRAFLPPAATQMMTGGKVDASAKLTTASQKYAVDGNGRLSQVRLRGQPAEGGFDLHAVFDPATRALSAQIDKLSLKGPGVDLGGRISLATSAAPAKGRAPAPTTVRFAIAGPLLDLGQVMSLAPERPKKEKTPAASLTAEQRRTVKALDVEGTLAIDKVVKGSLVASGFKAKATLEQGGFVLQDAGAALFGGRVDASGTRLDLAPALPTWDLKAKLDAVDLGAALDALGGGAPLVGKLDGALDLAGAGADWTTLKNALTGKGAVHLKDGALTTADLAGKAQGALSQALSAVGKGSAAKAVGGGGKTPIRDLAAQFTVKDGAMTLAHPLSLDAPFGAANLGGKIGLGGELGLDGTLNLSKGSLEPVTRLAGVGAPANLSVPLALRGSLESPQVSVDAGSAAQGLVSGAVKAKVQSVREDVEGRARKEAQRGVSDLLHSIGK